MKIHFVFRRIVAGIAVIVLCSSSIGAGFTGKENTFKDEWKKVDSLTNLGQPRSALEIVEKIYGQARNEKNYPQFLKAVLYRTRLKADFQEFFLEQAVRDIKADFINAPPPVTAVLHSILGEVYWRYYQNNQFRFMDRTRLSENRSDSLATWDLNTLMEAITNEYLLSLNNDKVLKSIPIEQFSAILDKPVTGSEKKDETPVYRPTLYDFLAHRALEFFTATDGPPNQSANLFRLDRPDYFSQTSGFTTLNGGVTDLAPHTWTWDSIAPDYFAFRIFQALAAFHAGDQDPRALIDAELARLEFVHDKAMIPGRDSLYMDALDQFEQNYISFPSSTQISFALAGFMNDQGNLYQPLVSTVHKWDRKAAIAICERAITKFPDSEGARNCKILKASIEESSLSVNTEKGVQPEKPILSLLKFRNLAVVSFRLIQVDPENFREWISGKNREEILTLLLGLPVIRQWNQKIPNDGDYQEHSMEIKIPEALPGYYVLLGMDDSSTGKAEKTYAYSTFWVTNISYVSQRQPDGSIGIFILHRETGKPLKNVTVEVMASGYNPQMREYQVVKIKDDAPDPIGFLRLPPQESGTRNSNIFLKIHCEDELLITDGFYQYPVSEPEERSVLQTCFFTDRAIYRPGQTIWFKGIVIEKTGDRSKLKQGKTIEVTFTDVNGQKIAQETFTTNEFGSFNGSFIAPSGVLSGQMTISGGYGSIQVSVEEYKRPTFEVTFHPLEGNYKLNESIEVSGTVEGFAGYPVSSARIGFRVIRHSRFPFWDRWYIPCPVSKEVEIINGITTTDEYGKFSVKFPAIPDYSVDPSVQPVFDFQVILVVTAANGETHPAETNVTAGYTSMLLQVMLPDKLNLRTDSLIRINATNLNGKVTPAPVMVLLERLKQPDRPLKSRFWQQPDLYSMSRQEFHAFFPYDTYGNENDPMSWPRDTVYKISLHTATDTVFLIQNPDKGIRVQDNLLTPGSYLMTFTAQDPYGKAVQKKLLFTAFNPLTKLMPVIALSWFVPVETVVEPGENAEFILGSSEDDINVISEIWNRDSLVNRTLYRLSDRILYFEIPVKEQYRGNFSVNYLFIKHSRAFQFSRVISVPYTNKKLDITFETFRDKLEPGQQEEWRVRICDASKKPVFAELLASMYDASLDVFRSNKWFFELYPRYYGSVPWDTDNNFTIGSGLSYHGRKITETYTFPEYDRLNWFGLGYFSGYYRYRYAKGKGGILMMQADADMAGSSIPMAGEQPPEETGYKEAAQQVPPEESPALKEKPKPEIQIRRDFRETAFFYPALRTDSSGNLTMTCTMPDALTRWKLMGLAHTTDLRYGMIEKEILTRKELMVFPNVPRFVRQGDTLLFKTTIVNMSGKDLSCQVTIALTDPVTLKPLDHLVMEFKTSADPSPHKSVIPSLNIPKGANVPVTWKIMIPVNPAFSLLQYRITAQSGNFSDGEQRIIPVLTNRMLVTETLPLPVRGKGSFDFTFAKLSQSSGSPDATLKNYKLTLEFSSNPSWYAVQALPSLNDRPYNNADAIFAAFYANSIASHIIHSNPKIRAVFESWKHFTPDALKSNLEKNQELKTALLQETPWVLDANYETERKQKLGLWFDLNNIRNNLQQNLQKLQKLQAPNGGWGWFEGMPESRYITQEIVLGMGHLAHLGIAQIRQDPGIWNMIVKAIGFLDDQIVKDYENLKRYPSVKLDEYHIGHIQIQYLYARSYFIDEIPLKPSSSTMREAFDYYLSQASRYWLKQDLYMQGMIALTLKRLGSGDTPQLIMKSLAEKALHSDEMGMYWALPSGWYWYQAPVETQALLIEAFDEVSNDLFSVEEMKVWLLKQKQTQDWKSDRATVEACYAILLRGTDLLSEEPDVKISVGSEKIDPAKLIDTRVEAGTGYFQLSWAGTEINPEMGKVKVSKSTSGASWGALYWQYFENLDKITPASTPLKLEKKVFVERNTP